jgi:hypothetical protein
MKNLIIPARAIPGIPIHQIIDESIELARESDAVIEVEVDSIQLHVLPQSTREELDEQHKVKTGKKLPKKDR